MLFNCQRTIETRAGRSRHPHQPLRRVSDQHDNLIRIWDRYAIPQVYFSPASSRIDVGPTNGALGGFGLTIVHFSPPMSASPMHRGIIRSLNHLVSERAQSFMGSTSRRARIPTSGP